MPSENWATENWSGTGPLLFFFFIGLDKEGSIVLAIKDENKFDDLFL